MERSKYVWHVFENIYIIEQSKENEDSWNFRAYHSTKIEVFILTIPHIKFNSFTQHS